MPIHPALPRRAFRVLPAAALWLALVALVAACSGTSPGQGVVSLTDPSASPDPAASPAASVDPEEAMLAFQTCMREHGIDIDVAFAPANGSDGGGDVDVKVNEPVTGGAGPAQPATGFDAEKLKAAEQACEELLPEGGRGDPSRTMDPELQDQLLAFAQCMRDHGVDFPDPQFDGGRVTVGFGPGAGGDDNQIDPGSATFKAAQEACGQNLPGGGPFQVGAGPVDGTEAKP
jgi:hypothetical protein